MRVLKRELVVLAYAENNCCVRILRLGKAPEKILVNCRDGLWFYRGTAHQIGEHRNCGPDSAREGVIGVYDGRRLEQLNSMLHAAEYATRPPPCPFD